MRHDYQHPPNWQATTDAEKARWYTLERVRRQAERQSNAEAERLARQRNKADRRAARKHSTRDIERNR